MRTLIQRVSHAEVAVDSQTVGKIGKGLLLLVGIETADQPEDLLWSADKIVNMRIFADGDGKMNLSVLDVEGEMLVVSQFTLHASTKKGNRPSFIRSAPPIQANQQYELFKTLLSERIGKPVESGVFGADMKVALLNDGPVTIWLDSKNRE
jgi:D-tyrosyl-tRNA(Tyr) deacylase